MNSFFGQLSFFQFLLRFCYNFNDAFQHCDSKMSILFPEKMVIFILTELYFENDFLKTSRCSKSLQLENQFLNFYAETISTKTFFFYKKVNFLEVLSPKLEVVLEITYQPLTLHTSPSPNSLSDKAKISRKFPSDLFFCHLGSLKSVEKVSRFI